MRRAARSFPTARPASAFSRGELPGLVPAPDAPTTHALAADAASANRRARSAGRALPAIVRVRLARMVVRRR